MHAVLTSAGGILTPWLLGGWVEFNVFPRWFYLIKIPRGLLSSGVAGFSIVFLAVFPF
jgi:hypothetical protein